jgi:hypothetical protein
MKVTTLLYFSIKATLGIFILNINANVLLTYFRVMADEFFPGGLSILSLNPRITEDFMDDELKQTLVLNG